MSTAVKRGSFAVVCQAGFFFFRPGQVVESSCVESRGVMICTTGEGTIDVDGQRFKVSPGTVLSLPWARHVVHVADRKQPMSIVMCHVVPAHQEGCSVEFAVAHEPEHALHRNPARQDGLWAGERLSETKVFRVEQHSPMALVATLCARWYLRRQWRVDEAQWLAQLLGRELERAASDTTPLYPEASPEVGLMLNFLEQNLHRPVRIAELASLTRRSQSHVTKVFRRSLGVSPKHYLQDKRMARARELLHTSNLSIAEVGQAVGLPNAYHFSRGFSQAVGASPSVYRRKHRSV